MSTTRTTLQTAASVALLAGAAFAFIAITPMTQPTIAATQMDDDAYTRQAKRDNLRLMSKAITLDVVDQPVEDVFRFLADVTGADLEPIYLDNNATSAEGIDRETLITLKATNVPAIALLERILDRTNRIEQPGDDYTWQFTDSGSIEFGPKSELNRNQRLEIYDIADLLFIVPTFDNAPQFNLQSAIQQGRGGGGGGGGTSPFSNSNDDIDTTSDAERAAQIQNLIETTIEPDQWANAGGDGASITIYGDNFIVTAPDYVHRQIDGYDFWPSRLTQVRFKDGQRDVRIKGDPKYRKTKSRP
ncbi:MAG: hypothetical protein JKY96_04725 [Phycisphaerales bacterium]|nr:hypothetical protein [Phycisphaerales bacterium]